MAAKIRKNPHGRGFIVDVPVLRSTKEGAQRAAERETAIAKYVKAGTHPKPHKKAAKKAHKKGGRK